MLDSEFKLVGYEEIFVYDCYDYGVFGDDVLWMVDVIVVRFRVVGYLGWIVMVKVCFIDFCMITWLMMFAVFIDLVYVIY